MIGPQQFYNIQLADFYGYVIDIMADFHFSLHHSVKDMKGKRRIENWVDSKKDDIHALVWIEVVKSEEELDPYITTDVLRAMNDENVTTLFFFTNGNLEDEDRDLLEGNNHFVFSTQDIVESLLALESKKAARTVRKRKNVKVASAMILIKNFLKSNTFKRKPIKLKTSAIPELTSQYTKLIRKVLEEIDSVDDINLIDIETREKFKKIQYQLLPELLKTANYQFTPRFGYLRDYMFSMVEHTIIYIGNLIEYEAEDDLKKNRDLIEDIIEKLDNIDSAILDFSQDLIVASEKISKKIIINASVITLLAAVLFLLLKNL